MNRRASRALAMIGLLSASLAAATALGADPTAQQRAAARFAQGERLYDAGRYDLAIELFKAANQLTPHSATLFNIARCHQNLSRRQQAITIYEQALAAEPVGALRASIEQRLSLLREQPLDVFISSDPPGAQVTIGSRAKPESKTTPLVLKLRPGAHLVVFRLTRHQLKVEQIEVGEQTRKVHVALARTPPPCGRAACSAERLGSDLLRLSSTRRRFQGVKAHFSAQSVFNVIRKWHAIAGFGASAGVSIGAIYLGGNLVYYPLPSSPNTRSTSLLTAAAEFAYVFPFRRFYVAIDGSLGGFVDRVDVFTGNTVTANEGQGFAFGLGGGIHAMAQDWLSVGLGLRGGGLIGDRAERQLNEGSDEGFFPYLMVTGSLGLHL